MRREILTAAVAGAVLLAGCAHPAQTAARKSASVVVETPSPTAKPKARGRAAAPTALRRFRDCTAVTTDLRAEALRYVGPYGLPGSGGGPVIAFSAAAAAGGDKAASPQGAAASAPQPGVDYSQTNVQEQGVDEPDTVKTDGRHIFVASGQNVYAAAIGNGSPSIVGKLTVDGYGMQLLLAGDRLLVVNSGGPVMQPLMRGGVAQSMPVQANNGPQTTVQVVDVSNPSSMRVVSVLHIDGYYVAARQIDGVTRLVVQRPNPAIGFAYPQDVTKVALDNAASANRSAVLNATTAQWIPRYKLDAGGRSSEGALSSCAQTYRPAIFSGFGSVTVVTIDPRNPVPHEGSTVIGSGGTVYASPTNLYVTSQRMPVPAPMPTDRPADVVPVPDATQIHKFDISGRSAIYQASGAVDGTVLNQFSMSEYAGDLRIATTIGPVSEFPTQTLSHNAVTVLRQQGGALVQIGRVGGLGAGQRIYAVRFIGPVAYVVTFRQIDPLYTLDLHNPLLPRVVGQLHIPGFSAYLHPLGDGLLLGIGDQVDASARPIASKASLFDVSDLAHPKDLQDLKLSGPEYGQFDPHAFLWWAPRGLAVIPVQDYNVAGQNQNPFAGAIALDIHGRMRVLKTLSHPAQSRQVFQITRSLVADNMLFTVSDEGLMANDLGSLAQRAWLPFN